MPFPSGFIADIGKEAVMFADLDSTERSFFVSYALMNFVVLPIFGLVISWFALKELFLKKTNVKMGVYQEQEKRKPY